MQMKLIAYGKSEHENKIVGVANFDLGDFLNSHMTLFNSKEKLTRCDDRRASIGYQLAFEVKDGVEEKTNPRTETVAMKQYSLFEP